MKTKIRLLILGMGLIGSGLGIPAATAQITTGAGTTTGATVGGGTSTTPGGSTNLGSGTSAGTSSTGGSIIGPAGVSTGFGTGTSTGIATGATPGVMGTGTTGTGVTGGIQSGTGVMSGPGVGTSAGSSVNTGAGLSTGASSSSITGGLTTGGASTVTPGTTQGLIPGIDSNPVGMRAPPIDFRGQTLTPDQINQNFLTGFSNLDLQNVNVTPGRILDLNNIMDTNQVPGLMNALRNDGAALQSADQVTRTLQERGLLSATQRIVGVAGGQFIRVDNSVWEDAMRSNPGTTLDNRL